MVSLTIYIKVCHTSSLSTISKSSLHNSGRLFVETYSTFSHSTFAQQSKHLLYSTIVLEIMCDVLERKFLSKNKQRKGIKPRVNTNVTRLEVVSSKMSSRNRLVQSGKPTDWHVMSTDPEVRKRKGGLFSCARLEFLRDSSAFAKGPGMGTRVLALRVSMPQTIHGQSDSAEFLVALLPPPCGSSIFRSTACTICTGRCASHDGWIIFAKIRRICLITGWDA